MHRTVTWSLVVGLALLLAACESDGSGTATDKSGIDDRGVVDKTGNAPGTKKFAGKVCDLLTAAEVQTATKIGQALTPVEGGGGDEDRVCNYMIGGTGSVLAVSLQGEREPVDWGAVKALPNNATIDVKGAEARFVTMNGTLYVYKNGLTTALLIVVPDADHTIAAKLAQTVANRLP